MTQTPPSIPSTVQVTGASSGLVARKRWRQAGQSGQLKLNGSAVDPGPWKVNVNFPVANGSAEGGVIDVIMGFYPKSSVGALAATPPTGCQAPGPSSGFEFVPEYAWYQTISLGTQNGTTAWTDTTGFFYGQGMAFNPFVSQFIGRFGSTTALGWWTGLPDMGTDAAFGSFPVGIDTAFGTFFDQDPEADFDNPIVVVFFQSAGAVLSEGRYPPPFLESSPPTPGPGSVTLYNNIVRREFPLRFGPRPDELGFAESGGPELYESPHRRDVVTVVDGVVVVTPFDATCFTNRSYFAYADITQPPDAPTRAADTAQAGSGLIAVG